MKDSCIIYSSKNRPLQLDLAISSNRLNCKDWDSFDHYIIYKAENDKFQNAYNQLQNEHKDCIFIKEDNYKRQFLEIMLFYENTIFSVDDVIYFNDYSVVKTAETLKENPRALGFSLRTGKNTTYCYSQNKQHRMPQFEKVKGNIIAYNWISELMIYNGDFGFPLEVSGSMYRSRDLLFIMENTKWENPNTLEGALYSNLAGFQYLPKFLLYNTSVCYCNPINKVFLDKNANRTGEKFSYPADFLLEKFLEGYRIPPEKYKNIIPNSAHQEVDIL